MAKWKTAKKAAKKLAGAGGNAVKNAVKTGKEVVEGTAKNADEFADVISKSSPGGHAWGKGNPIPKVKYNVGQGAAENSAADVVESVVEETKREAAGAGASAAETAKRSKDFNAINDLMNDRASTRGNNYSKMGEKEKAKVFKSSAQPPRSGPTKANESSIPPAPEQRKMPGKRVKQYMDDRFQRNVDDIGNLFDESGKAMDGSADKIMKEFRVDESQREAVERTLRGGKDRTATYLGKQKDEYARSANLLDGAFAYRAPQIAGTGVAASYLIQNMSDNKGRQSNSQLYNQ